MTIQYANLFNGSGAGLYDIPGTSVNGPIDVAKVTGLSKSSVGLSNVDNTSDVNKPVSTAQAAANTLKYDKAGGGISGPAYTSPISVPYNPTPTFNAGASNVFYLGTMTANVLAMTITNPSDGQTIMIRVVQDATGARTVALPTGAKVSGFMGVAANSVTWLILTYVSPASRWEGTWSVLPA